MGECQHFYHFLARTKYLISEASTIRSYDGGVPHFYLERFQGDPMRGVFGSRTSGPPWPSLPYKATLLAPRHTPQQLGPLKASSLHEPQSSLNDATLLTVMVAYLRRGCRLRWLYLRLPSYRILGRTSRFANTMQTRRYAAANGPASGG